MNIEHDLKKLLNNFPVFIYDHFDNHVNKE